MHRHLLGVFGQLRNVMHRKTIFLALSLVAGAAHAEISFYSGSLQDFTVDYSRYHSDPSIAVFVDSHSVGVTSPSLATLHSSSSVPGSLFSISQQNDATGKYLSVPTSTSITMAGTVSSFAEVTASDPDRSFQALEQAFGILRVDLTSTGTYSLDITNISHFGSGLTQISSKIDNSQVGYGTSTADVHLSGIWSAGTHYLDVFSTARPIQFLNSGHGSESANYRFSVQTTPEPATLSVFGFGALAFLRKRRGVR